MDDDRSAKDKAIIEIAQNMIDGSVGLVEGARNIVQLCEWDNPIFFPIVGLESETEGYIIGPSRSLRSEEYLLRTDRSVEDYLKRATPAIVDACKTIVRDLSNRAK